MHGSVWAYAHSRSSLFRTVTDITQEGVVKLKHMMRDANPFVEVRVDGVAVSVRHGEPVHFERVVDTAKT